MGVPVEGMVIDDLIRHKPRKVAEDQGDDVDPGGNGLPSVTRLSVIVRCHF